MAGVAAQGLVSYSVATEADAADIARLLRENPMPGAIQLSLEETKSSATTTTILARDDAGRAIAMGSVAVRDAYVNGDVRRVGYLGQLRLDARVRPRASVIIGGYQFFRELLPAIGADLYFTSIAVDNAPAVRLLERGLGGMPAYLPIDDLLTSLFPVQAVKLRTKVRVDNAGDERLGEIVALLSRNARRFNLAPAWTEEELRPLIESEELEFAIATHGGRVVGCIGTWDQSAYKRAVIRGYSPRLARWRRLNNLAAPLLRTPYLPPIDTPLNLIYLSHLAVDDNAADVFLSLLRYGCSSIDKWFGGENRSYFVLGLSAQHPLSVLLPDRFHRFRRQTYRTRLYAVDFADGAFKLDDRPVQPEVALL